MKILFLSILLLGANINTVFARPVSYPTGWTVMLMNDTDANSAHVHYSPTAKYSVGFKHTYLREPKANLDTIQLNNLLKRWNKKGEQANLYLKSGVGIATESGDITPAAYTGLAVDWETRRYFTSYENQFLYAKDVEQNVKHKARVGIAPYIGDYGDLHTWLMIQADYDAGDEDSFSVTPLIRLFKGSTLVEGGYNLDNGIQANFIQRF